MANYNTISRSSYDYDTTKKLQQMLNASGNYNLAEDGIFGSNTENAVRQYQKANGLTADGIVGKNTWGALTGSSSSGSSSAAAPAPVNPMEKYTYKPSDTVTQAGALLEQLKAQKPGEFTGTWGDQIAGKVQEILNGKDFTYDVNRDALYQQLREQYSTMGQMAMMDTMGQAAALTGGYGNSWAQSAGQQAYQQYLQQLTQQVPELYGMALDKHNQDRQALYDQASLLAGMEDQEYSRYMDHLTNYYTELGLAQDEARYQAELDYGRYMDKLGLDYQMERDKIADEQWQKQFDESVRQYNEQMALSKSKVADSSGNKKTYPTPSTQAIKNMQMSLGVEADGVWGPKSKAAAGGLDVGEAYSLFNQGKLGYSQVLGMDSPGIYKDVAAYIEENGGDASELMDAVTWATYRNMGSNVAPVANYANYQEYLSDFIKFALGE